jgi:hypothetical protein
LQPDTAGTALDFPRDPQHAERQRRRDEWQSVYHRLILRASVWPDNQLGLYAYAWWVFAQADKFGISQDQLTPEIAERLRIELLGLDTDNDDPASLEKALQVIARGDLARGGSMFRRHMQRQTINATMQDETKTGRKRQPANAKKPRTRALQALILEIMNHRPAMTRNQLLAELRKHEKGEVIYTINDAERIIEWEDKNGRVQSTQFSALKDRMSRARKNLRSLSG